MRLIIAEKPSVGKAISPVVGAVTKKDGYTEGNGYIVSWCFGHLVGLKDPDEYCESWAAKPWTFEVLPMLPDTWQFKVHKDCKEQFNILKKLMNDSGVDEIICATDADREGECIFRYVYDLIGCRKPVKRLWISSLEQSAIKAGLAKMKSSKEYDSLFSAGYCRARADWLVGMNGSRIFSTRYKQHLTLGRVQTPTLAMIVKRDHDVANYVKQKYFTVGLLCETENGAFVAESDRIDDEKQADALCAAVSGKTAQITELKKENKITNPPKLYDLTTLQRECNKYFGYTAQQTLNALQKLYEQKLATYPRTDSQYLSDDMEQTALHVISVISTVYPELSYPSPDVKRCINNKKVTGHHAIIPTENIKTAELTNLPENQQNVLYLLSAKLIMASSMPQKYESTKVTVRCEGTDFKANGKIILDDGWKAAEARFKAKLKNQDINQDKEQNAADGDQKLPELIQGQTFQMVYGEPHEHWTSPPKPYTEDTLLTAMEHAGQDEYDEDTEKKGLGTPATRAAVIEGLVKHGYVERKKKQIFATETGIQLIQVVPDEVKSPKLTAEWEMKLQQMEHGSIREEQFMSEITAYVKMICKKYGTEDSSVSFRKPQDTIGKCPKCGKNVLSFSKVYACEAGKDACGFHIFKSISGKEISDTHAKQLLTKKKTDLIRGFTSKTGKKFDAHLVLREDLSLGFAFPSGEIGKCPLCGKAVISYPKTYSCEDSKNGCTFVIWKTISGLTIPEAQAKKLLTKGKTDLLKGFTSKAGKKFDAYLVLKGEQKQVGFEFPVKENNQGEKT